MIGGGAQGANGENEERKVWTYEVMEGGGATQFNGSWLVLAC